MATLELGRSGPEPLGLTDVNGVAALLKVTPRTVWRYDTDGKLPRRVTIGGSVRWRFQEIVDWIKAGCPRREEWEARNITADEDEELSPISTDRN